MQDSETLLLGFAETDVEHLLEGYNLGVVRKVAYRGKVVYPFDKHWMVPRAFMVHALACLVDLCGEAVVRAVEEQIALFEAH